IESTACLICVHGKNRAAHRHLLTTLFHSVSFHVVAPSPTALEIYLRAGRLCHLSERVHENAVFLPTRPPQQRSPRGIIADPIRIAFAGYPVPHKGWSLFLKLVQQAKRYSA